MTEQGSPSGEGTPQEQGSPAGQEAHEEAARDDALGRASGYARGLAALILLAGIGLAVAGIVVVVNQLTQPGGSVPVLISDPDVLAFEQPDGLPEGANLRLGAALDELELHVAELPAVLRALTESATLLAALLALTGAVFVRSVLLHIASGRPFAAVVPRRLAGLAVTLLALAILPSLVDNLATVLVLEHLGHAGEGSPIGFTIFELQLLPVLFAAGIAITAAVFRHGQRLTEDVEGLV